MAVSATFTKPVSLPAGLARMVQIAAGLAVLAALAVPLLTAGPGPLTSDESLYVSEGLNIAEGKGFTYASGEAVHHRGPLFPALLGADFAVSGFSLDHAYWVTKLFALGGALLLLAAGWRFFGREAGLLAAAAAMASSLLTMMGTSLWLDTAESFFLLLTLVLLHPALLQGRPLLAGLAGGALGLAMLTKESALLWLPLPFLAVLLTGSAVRRPGRLLAAFGLGFLLTAGWWWPYVYAVTGQVYLLGAPSHAALWLTVGMGAIAVVAGAAVAFARRDAPFRLSPGARWTAVSVLLLAWGVLFILGMERNSGWDFPARYATSVPDYTVEVLASWVQPLPLIALAWCYAGYRGYHGSFGDRLLLLGLLLFMPFAIFAANRALHVRDMLPLVYLSYVALGRAAVDLARWLARFAGEGLRPAGAGAAVGLVVVAAFGWFALEETQRFGGERDAFDAELVQQANWDNPLAWETAAWIEEHVPAGARIMSGRLYSTHLYSLTGAQYRWWQLPTVRVDIDERAGGLAPATTLFRWEDHLMPQGPAEPWLYLRRYPVKGYYVALSERHLIAALDESEIEYLILTGDDAGFSSLSLLPYFETHPHFKLLQSFVADEANQTHVFQVVGSFEEPTEAPALVSDATVAALEGRMGKEQAARLLEGLSPGGFATSSAYAAVRPPAE